MNSADNSAAEVFPLPLSSMEKFHLLDSRPGDPNHVYCKLKFAGVIDRDAVDSSIEFLTNHQPLFSAVVEKRGGRYFWCRKELRPEVIWYEWGQAANTADFDIEQCTGLRFHIWTSETETIVLFQVHHTLMDGAGSVTAINDFLRSYHNAVKGIPVDEGIKSNDPALLKGRNQLNLFSKRYLRHLYKQPVALFGAWKFIFRKFVTLLPENESKTDAGANQSGTPEIYGEWLSAETLSQLKSTSRERKITLNTLMLAKLFLSVHQWKTARNAADAEEWFRIILPMNMRSVSDRRLPATNRSTVVQIDRRKAQMDAWDTFLLYLDREVGIIRDWHLHRMFLLFIRCMSVSSAVLKRSAKSSKPRGTAILTNLGTPFRWSTKKNAEIPTGNMELVDIDFVGPVRANTPVNFSVQEHGDRLRLSIHFDPGQIGTELAQELFQEYRTELERKK